MTTRDPDEFYLQDWDEEVPAWVPKMVGTGLGVVAGTTLYLVLYIVLLMTLWIWALVVTIKYWKEISLWAKIIAILGLLFNISISISLSKGAITTGSGSLITLLVVYISRSLNKRKQ